MRHTKNNANSHTKRTHNTTQRPEVRDNLDSRQGKEDGYVDHNNKAGRKPNSKDKNDAGN